jgi:hypothetical protein
MTRARRLAAAGVAALALLIGCGGSEMRHLRPASAATLPPQVPVADGVGAARGFRSVRGYRATPVPVRVVIPRIRVDSTLVGLGREPDGSVETPARWEQAGWYEHGPRPGEPGSAVVLGHVDSTRGPAVFYRLRELRRGDQVLVRRADGSSLRFVVERTGRYDKRRFPTDEVYYPTLTSALRLVTCGGEFDARTGHYRSNVIVFARLG